MVTVDTWTHYDHYGDCRLMDTETTMVTVDTMERGHT